MLSAGQIEKGHAKLLASLDPDEAEAAATAARRASANVVAGTMATGGDERATEE